MAPRFERNVRQEIPETTEERIARRTRELEEQARRAAQVERPVPNAPVQQTVGRLPGETTEQYIARRTKELEAQKKGR